MDDAVLRGAALNANRNLELLEEIIRMAKNRESVDRYQLALMVGALLSIVQIIRGESTDSHRASVGLLAK